MFQLTLKRLIAQIKGKPVVDYEAELERFYRGLNLNGKVVVDIGAHIGRHTIPFSEMVGAQGMVFAFEPVPDIRESLTKNLRSAKCNNVAVLPFALANRDGSDSFVYTPQAPGESGLKRREIYNTSPTVFEDVQVVVKRLDDVVPSSADVGFIKIDVEGGELDALMGANATLTRSRPVVAFESGAAAYSGYHNTPGEIFQIFSKLGYRIISITGISLESEEAFVKANEVQAFWDYLALPDDRN